MPTVPTWCEQTALPLASTPPQKRHRRGPESKPQQRGAFGSTRANQGGRAAPKHTAKSRAKPNQKPAAQQGAATSNSSGEPSPRRRARASRQAGQGGSNASSGRAPSLEVAAERIEALRMREAKGHTALGGVLEVDRFLDGHAHGSGNTVLVLNTQQPQVLQSYHPGQCKDQRRW